MSVILSDEIIAEYWKELFDRNNYSFNNSTFSNRESAKKSVWIPYSDIESVSEEFAAYLMSYPERILSLGRETLRSTAETDEEMCIRVTGLPDNCLREMGGIDSGNSDFISVKGIVTKFEPLNIKQNNGIKTILSEIQTVVISDNPKGFRAMELRLGGDLLGTEICGKTLTFNGFYRDDDFSDDSGTIIVSRHFEVNSIGTADSPFDIAFSEEDIKEIQKASEDPLFFDNQQTQLR